MALEVKDPNTIALAEQLAERRKASVAEIFRDALQHEWEREEKIAEMEDKLRAFHAKVRAISDPSKGQPADKAFIDSLYEDD